MNFFKGLLEDNTGGYSSMRAAFLVWTIGTFFVWGYCSFAKVSLAPIDSSLIAMVGAVTSAKVIQRFGEKDPEADPTKIVK